MASNVGRRLPTIALCALFAAPQALAQGEAAASSLRLELNGLEKSTAGCRLTFVVQNGLGAALSNAAFEIVLFDKAGLVKRLTVLEFKDLPAGKTKVQQFDLPQIDCESVSRVLVNDAVACEGEGIDAAACIGRLNVQTKSDVTFGS